MSRRSPLCDLNVLFTGNELQLVWKTREQFWDVQLIFLGKRTRIEYKVLETRVFANKQKKARKQEGLGQRRGGRGSGGELRAGRSGSRVGLQRARPVTTRNGSRRRRRRRRTRRRRTRRSRRRTRRRRSRAYPGSRSSTGPRAVLSTCWWSYDGPEDPRGRLMHQHQHQHQLHQQLRQ